MYHTSNLPNTRIDVADALRGIAVAGIILYHSVEHFNIFTQETIVYPLSRVVRSPDALPGVCVCCSYLALSMWRSTMATS